MSSRGGRGAKWQLALLYSGLGHDKNKRCPQSCLQSHVVIFFCLPSLIVLDPESLQSLDCLCLFRKHRVTSPPCWTVSNEQDNLWGQMGGWAHHRLPHMCSPCGLRLLPGKNTIFQFWFPTRSGRSYICIDFLSLSAGRLRSSSVLSQTQRLLPVWHDHVGQQALWCGQTISLHRDIRLPCLDQWCHWRLLKLLSNHVSIALHLFLIHFSQNKNNQKFYHSLIFFFPNLSTNQSKDFPNAWLITISNVLQQIVRCSARYFLFVLLWIKTSQVIKGEPWRTQCNFQTFSADSLWHHLWSSQQLSRKLD